MKRTLALVGVTLASLAVLTTPAWASDTGPGTQACTEAQVALANAPKTVPNPRRGELQEELNSLRSDEDVKTQAAEDMGLELGVSEEEAERLQGIIDDPNEEESRKEKAQEKLNAVNAALEAKAKADAKEAEYDEAGEEVPNPELERLEEERDAACERDDFRRDRDRDDDDDDDRDEARDGEDGRDGRDGRDGVDGKDGVTTTVFVPTSEASNSGNVPLPVGGVATGVGPA